MQYGNFRAKGCPCIGSGVVEAGCKTVIGAAASDRACFGRNSGAPENILALRCIHSRRLEEFWKDRLNGRAAHSDALPWAA